VRFPWCGVAYRRLMISLIRLGAGRRAKSALLLARATGVSRTNKDLFIVTCKIIGVPCAFILR